MNQSQLNFPKTLSKSDHLRKCRRVCGTVVTLTCLLHLTHHHVLARYASLVLLYPCGLVYCFLSDEQEGELPWLLLVKLACLEPYLHSSCLSKMPLDIISECIPLILSSNFEDEHPRTASSLALILRSLPERLLTRPSEWKEPT